MEYYKNLDLKDIVYFCEFDLIEKTEQWKDIPNYEGIYQASDLGRIKNLIFNKGKVRTGFPSSSGHLSLSLALNKKSKCYSVHQLIAITFLNFNPKKDFNIIVDHINNVKFDNRLKNLQITTRRVNNSKDRKNKSSKYTGVYWSKQDNMWRAELRNNGVHIFLCLSKNEEYAYNIYLSGIKNLDKFNGCKKEFRILIKKDVC